MILAEILAISQDLSFEDGSTTNYAVLRLSNNKVVKALISDETAQTITDLAAQEGRVQAPPPPQAPEATFGTTRTEEGAVVFDGPTEPAPRPKILSVSKTTLGYPVVRTEGGRDPSDVLGDGPADEDGVSQL